ncbi:hypothetical protein EVAR_11126_1 [Eumeta japonica]|uniref:Uncharacterized protein n=1 Tax=Eumeta variegata TaxID=151549 RepID=A0A4C1U3X9_EUMVA|nr:hypothetical protein EVAR_11126_1 [Eumeta japonica]
MHASNASKNHISRCAHFTHISQIGSRSVKQCFIFHLQVGRTAECLPEDVASYQRIVGWIAFYSCYRSTALAAWPRHCATSGSGGRPKRMQCDECLPRVAAAGNSREFTRAGGARRKQGTGDVIIGDTDYVLN